MYQAIYFEVTGLVYFTLSTSILMVLVNFVRVIVGLYRSVNEEADMLNKELEEIRAQVEGTNSAPAASMPSTELVEMPNDQVAGCLRDLSSRLAHLEAQDCSRLAHLEERMALLERSHKEQAEL